VGVTIGTDYPAAEGGALGANPLLQIQCAVTRQQPAVLGADERIQPPIDERMSVAHAVEAFTINGAKQMRLDKSVGSLEIGKKADLIILSENIFDVQPNQIGNSEVIFTLFNGQIVHDAIFQNGNVDSFEDLTLNIDLCDE